MTTATNASPQVDVSYDTTAHEDGTVTIRRTVFTTPRNGRGLVHAKMECTSQEDWVVASYEEAFDLAKDIMLTLAFFKPVDMAAKRAASA